MSKHPKPSPEVEEYAKELAALLGETDPVPIKQVRRIVHICGIDFARELYQATAVIEDQGGIMLPDNTRRRTRGGVFFYLVRKKADEQLRQIIFPTYKNLKPSKDKPALGVPLMTWDERIAIVQTLQSVQGEIKSMKIVLTGRPGSVEKRPEVVITTMSDIAISPGLPRGIPTPPTVPTVYAVYMSPKQWEKIEESLADPADIMTVEGVCAFDPETNGMAVFANTVHSAFVDAKIREEQKAAAAQAKPAKVNPPKAPKAASDGAAPTAKAASSTQPQAKSGQKSRIGSIQPEPVVAATAPLNPNLPPDVARKLNELQASASLFRQKVATIQGKPPGQQFGLEMTQKLLKNVEDEIATLEKKYNK